MNKTCLASSAVALCVALGACKKVEYRDRQETLDELERLRAELQEKTDFIKELRGKLAELEMGGNPTPVAEEGAWVFIIEGDALVIKARGGGGGGGGGQIDDAAATAMGEQFIDLVKKSRGSIQKCYEQALKKNSTLQARTVNLTLSVSFAASGSFSKVSFDYELPEGFDTCLRGVASKWKLPAAGASRTFQTTVKLTPT
jgi:hypothetical protein